MYLFDIKGYITHVYREIMSGNKKLRNIDFISCFMLIIVKSKLNLKCSNLCFADFRGWSAYKSGYVFSVLI